MTTEENKNLKVRDEIEKNNYLEVFGNENFPSEIQSGINEVMEDVAQNKTITDLYSNELQEIPVSTSIFQDICVQFGQHYTPHKKLRQAIMELDSKLGALDSAKNNHKKALVKVQQLEEEVNNLEEIYNQLDEKGKIDFDLGMLISSFTYTTGEGESKQTHNIISDSITNALIHGQEITNEKLVNIIQNRVKTALGNKIVEYEEAQRGLKGAKHMIKDAALKAYQYKKQIEEYRKEVEQSEYSYEEAEVVYYVMYFTSQIETQLRQGAMIDRGTFGAVSQLPDQIRRKVLDNASFIRKKIFEEDYPIDGDYIWKVYQDELLPKKTGEGEIEGLDVREFLKIEPIKLINEQENQEND